ncbi:MAG: SUMF1/EgtB/PvdO family nonheme iron enzyme [Chloroflexales bacterium]
MSPTSTSLPTDLRSIIADALRAYELTQVAHLREGAEQQRAAVLVAALDEAETAARTLLERAGLAHIAGAPASLDGSTPPVRRADQEVAAAFSAAQAARVELRVALLRLAYAYADTERWDAARRVVLTLLEDQQAPLYLDALALLCESHYAPAAAALQAQQWDAARQGFAAILELKADYRDTPVLHRESYLHSAQAALNEGAWTAVRELAETWQAIQPDDADMIALQCESYYAPATAALQAQQWETARQGFEAVLKLNTAYREAAQLRGEAVAQLLRERETAVRAQRERAAVEEAQRERAAVEEAQREHEVAQQAQREREATVHALINAGTFAMALDRLDVLLKQTPGNRDLATLAAQIAETPAAPFAQRMRAGKLASHAGDPRIPVTTAEWIYELDRRNEQFGQPSGYFCFVRPGTYQLGGWENTQPVADVTLPAFWLARYPITVAQYASFIPEGYVRDDEEEEEEAEEKEKSHRWWTPQGWGWQKASPRSLPASWGESAYSGANQPVVGITWYEASAYCTWLTTQLSNALPAGYELRLPSEAEWEVAAAYDAQMQRQPYPWGTTTLSQDRAVYGATRPAPVGCCPAGAAACGALDLVGNVWELMASSYAAYPEEGAVLRNDFTPKESDVPCRGGAWKDSGANVRCGARGGYLPDNVNRILLLRGLRVCVAPSAN